MLMSIGQFYLLFVKEAELSLLTAGRLIV